MSTLFRSVWGVGVLLIVAGAVHAKDFVVRCDVLESEYAAGDEFGLGEPAKTTLRYIEVKIDERSDFSHADAHEGWTLSIRGKATGFKDGRLGVDGLAFAYVPADNPGGGQTMSASNYTYVPGRIDRAGGSSSRTANGPLRELLVFYSAHEPAKGERAEEERCASVRKAVLEQVVQMRTERRVEHDDKEKAAARTLELAKQLLKDANDEGAGRVLLETLARRFGETQAGRKAKSVWNALPNVRYRFPANDGR
jgi:hypothetical protein